MKTAVILAQGVKQIVFTPENDQEKYALSLITDQDDIELVVESGSFGGPFEKPYTRSVDLCKGGYLRVFRDEGSRILVLKPKSEPKKKQDIS